MFVKLKLTDEKNTISLKTYQSRVRDVKICNSDKDGNIEIVPYKLSRECWMYSTKAKFYTGYYNDSEIWKYKRLSPQNEYINKEGDKVRMVMPKGQIVPPFLSKNIIEAYESELSIDTLYLTEGYIKALKLYIDGLHSVGLGSITLYKEKETNSMYEDIRTIINNCNVKNIAIIYDADCSHISVKDVINNRDVKRRPNNFLSSFKNIKELLKGYGLDVFFIALKNQDEKLKGIDDLLENIPEAINELKDIGLRSGKYFEKITELEKVEVYLGLDCVDTLHKNNLDKLKNRSFNYEKILYADESGKLIRREKNPDEIPFFAVDNNYYLFGEKNTLLYRKKEMLKDMGFTQNDFLNCRKFEGFANEPMMYEDYNYIIGRKLNLYVKYRPELKTDNCETILHLINHIFREQYELGLDYMWQLYFNRKQKLPVLCLLSTEQGTGKTTFAQTLMDALFGDNFTQHGNTELNDKWNDSYISKNVLTLNEITIEKKEIYEKVKTLSTEYKQPLQKRFNDSKDLPCYIRLIMCSNNEFGFMKLTKNDNRFWIRKIGVPNTVDINYVQNIKEEAGYFVEFLKERGCLYKTKGNRLFFDFEDIRTGALENVIEDSRNELYVEIFEIIKQSFYGNKDLKELQFTLTDIHEAMSDKKKYSKKWIKTVLRDDFELKPTLNPQRYEKYNIFNMNQVPDSKTGSYYTFSRSKFTSDELTGTIYEEQTIYQTNEKPF
jgi:hypothetical protein